MKRTYLSLLSALIFTSCQSAPIQEATSRDPSSVNHEGREEMERLAFGDLPKIHTDALLILKDGKVLYSRYARGYTENSKHLSWSMGKSIAGIIAAQAIEAKKFAISDPVERWVPDYRGKATVQDLFQMSSGIAYKEEYSGIPVNSDATRMLYLDGVKQGFAAYTAKLPKRSGVQPGDHFYYSSGDANLIMETMKNSFADQAKYDAFPWVSFFDRLGIPNATFEQDSKGTFVGSSYLYMTAPEYARIGQLLANRGKWGSEQIIPTWYFERMTEIAPGVMKNALAGTSATRAYSMQTTTNRPIEGRHLPSEYADLPADALLMIGHQGQLVIASPSENLVIVRLATDGGDPFNPSRPGFFGSIRKFLEQEHGIKITPAGPPRLAAAPPAKKKKESTPFSDYLKVPRLLRTLYAKEYCSCRFVVGRTDEQCREDLKFSLPILPRMSLDPEKGTVVTVLSGIAYSKAVYRGERLGCTLVK